MEGTFWDRVLLWLSQLWNGFLDAAQDPVFWVCVVFGGLVITWVLGFVVTWVLGFILARAVLGDSGFIRRAWRSLKIAMWLTAIIVGVFVYFVFYEDWAKAISAGICALLWSYLVFRLIYQNEKAKITEDSLIW